MCINPALHLFATPPFAMAVPIPLATACSPATFTAPSVFGAEILSIDTSLVTNFSASVVSAFRYTQPSITVSDATFCNVTVTYTHPGQNDHVIVEAWLPVDSPGWNQRLQAIGGGGFAAGRFELTYEGMKGALGDGYATITTDAGLGSSQEPSEWALLSPGNVNLYKLRNTGSVALNDAAIIGKSLIQSFYGEEPKYSYWNGCSGGGRQGLMLAQRYPDAFDGIAAGAPANYWTELFASMQWPEVFMNSIQVYPHHCEIDAITALAVKECDGLDGVADGVIADVDACLAKFDPHKTVGKPLNCSAPNALSSISKAAADVIKASWEGPFKGNGERIWYGLNPGADLTGQGPYAPPGGTLGLATTICTGERCGPFTFPLSDFWIRYFVAKDPTFKIGNVTKAEFERLYRDARREYHSMVGTDDPDLTDFRAAGGKLVTYHGLSDYVIAPKGTLHYHEAVRSLIPDSNKFYRHYDIPGMGHCFGGPTGQPTTMFDQLRAWVENGTAPGSSPYDLTVSGQVQQRIACPYPQKTKFEKKCGDVADANCWSCKGKL
ncbi:Tannase/feruloyl esterase [Immersiella caudata]|uniref:Carboxylic ester hydrolase n=1 Tax=Immersiella caudata TaxID=314043 RepID=A0AA39WZE4_9PEZI|nr:Tannase/feruloyl esterase [Immersiella caudata]